jgi:hypothetical protein
MSGAKHRLIPTDAGARRLGLDPCTVRRELSARVYLHGFQAGKDMHAWVLADSLQRLVAERRPS